jgi:hypothetical protein
VAVPRTRPRGDFPRDPESVGHVRALVVLAREPQCPVGQAAGVVDAVGEQIGLGEPSSGRNHERACHRV